MIHGVLVDGRIDKIDTAPQNLDAELEVLRAGGKTVLNLFTAETEADFQREKRKEEERRKTCWV